MRVFVLAETYKSYIDWCAARGVNPVACECVTDPKKILGQMKPGDQLLDARQVHKDLPSQLRVA